MSRRYAIDNPNVSTRRDADLLFESAQLASGAFRHAPIDVWGDVFHGMEAEGYDSDVAAQVARAASRAARAAFIRAIRAPRRMEPCPDCSEPARRDSRDALSCAECGYAEAYRGQGVEA